MKYIEWEIKFEDPGMLELAEAILIANDVYDIVVNDPRDITDLLNKKNYWDWDYVDESIMQREAGKPSIVIYTNMDGTLLVSETAAWETHMDGADVSAVQLNDPEDGPVNGRDAVHKVVEAFPEAVLTFKIHDDSEWKDKWKEFFKPAKITERLVVKPTWEEYKPAENELVINIDPGMAFGTGTHETTSLCLELIEKYMKKGDTLLDVGTGSGILAIAAGLLGASDALGIEIDPIAVDIAKENVELNHLSDIVKVQLGDLTDGVDYCADVVAANLMSELVKVLSKDVPRHIKPGGIYISSGILAVLKEEVSAAIEACGFEIIEILVKGDWCAIAAKMPE